MSVYCPFVCLSEKVSKIHTLDIEVLEECPFKYVNCLAKSNQSRTLHTTDSCLLICPSVCLSKLTSTTYAIVSLAVWFLQFFNHLTNLGHYRRLPLVHLPIIRVDNPTQNPNPSFLCALGRL